MANVIPIGLSMDAPATIWSHHQRIISVHKMHVNRRVPHLRVYLVQKKISSFGVSDINDDDDDDGPMVI